MQIFRKKRQKALNRLGTSWKDASRRERSGSVELLFVIRCLGRRAVVILLQEKSFDPNVIYYVSTFIDNNTKHKNIKGYPNWGHQRKFKGIFKGYFGWGNQRKFKVI